MQGKVLYIDFNSKNGVKYSVTAVSKHILPAFTVKTIVAL